MVAEPGSSCPVSKCLCTSVQTLFSYAKLKKYLPKDHDELDAVPLAKDKGGEIEIFTPVELEELLNAANDRLVPFLALGAFAGIRHAEIQRLDWADIKFDDELGWIKSGEKGRKLQATAELCQFFRTADKAAMTYLQNNSAQFVCIKTRRTKSTNWCGA